MLFRSLSLSPERGGEYHWPTFRGGEREAAGPAGSRKVGPRLPRERGKPPLTAWRMDGVMRRPARKGLRRQPGGAGGEERKCLQSVEGMRSDPGPQDAGPAHRARRKTRCRHAGCETAALPARHAPWTSSVRPSSVQGPPRWGGGAVAPSQLQTFSCGAQPGPRAHGHQNSGGCSSPPSQGPRRPSRLGCCGSDVPLGMVSHHLALTFPWSG